MLSKLRSPNSTVTTGLRTRGRPKNGSSAMPPTPLLATIRNRNSCRNSSSATLALVPNSLRIPCRLLPPQLMLSAPPMSRLSLKLKLKRLLGLKMVEKLLLLSLQSSSTDSASALVVQLVIDHNLEPCASSRSVTQSTQLLTLEPNWKGRSRQDAFGYSYKGCHAMNGAIMCRLRTESLSRNGGKPILSLE